MPQCLFLVPLAPRADLWIKILHDLTNLEALSPVNVSTPFFIWVRLLLHFFCYSDKHCYSFLTIIIPTEARNSLSGKRVRINLLSTQTYFTRTLKKDSIIYYCRYFAQQKVLFLLFKKIFFENSLSWKAKCYCWTHWNWEILCETNFLTGHCLLYFAVSRIKSSSYLRRETTWQKT